jgi:hypothetical protein
MAAVVAVTYAAIGVHSGLAHGAVRDTVSAIAAMSNGPLPPTYPTAGHSTDGDPPRQRLHGQPPQRQPPH